MFISLRFRKDPRQNACEVLNFGFLPAGVAFYSIADIADRLLSTPAHPVPSLEEDYWLSRCVPDPSCRLSTLLEELSPAAMAAFDLACCHCHLWKTSRQLLDTAERRLTSSLEARGMQPQFQGLLWRIFLAKLASSFFHSFLCLQE